MRSARSTRRAVGLTAGLILAGTCVLPTSATAASEDPSAAPSATARAHADPELLREVEERLAEDRERLESAETSPERAADATFGLRPDDATFELRPDDATTALESTHEEEGDTVVTLTSDLLFAFGSAELSPEAAEAVAGLAGEIPDGAEVAVDGHTDSVGPVEDNQDLSERRADAVAAVLEASRGDLTLEVAGHGEEDPVAENESEGADNPAGRALNRRVEVTYPTS